MSDSHEAGLARCENRRQFAQQLATQVDKFEQTLEKDEIRYSAALDAFDEYIGKILRNEEWWKKKLDGEECTEDEYKAAIKAINQCAGIARNACAKIREKRKEDSGRKTAYQEVIDLLEKTYKEEGEKAKQIVAYAEELKRREELEASGEIDRKPINRPIGVHPGKNKIAERKAAEQIPQPPSTPPVKTVKEGDTSSITNIKKTLLDKLLK